MKKLPVHVRILLGLVLGALAGSIVQRVYGPEHESVKWFVSEIASPAGTIFLNLIYMIVVPLLFAALVLGVSEIGNAKKLGRVGVRSLLLTLFLSSIAVIVGLAAVNIFKPGVGISEEKKVQLEQQFMQNQDTQKKVAQAEEVRNKRPHEYIVELFPSNPLQSASTALSGGLLPFMVFSLIFGIALSGIDPEKAQPVRSFLEGVFETCIRVVEFAMKYAPIGVFGLMFATTSILGVETLVSLIKYALVVLGALAFHQFVTYSLAVKYIAKRSPREFFRAIRGVMGTAFVTSSSNATLPAAIKSSEEDLGIPREVGSFVLTVGATANQNGTALFEGITLLFLAQFFNVPLDMGQQLTVLLLSILAGVGTAGVPGGSWPMIAVICGMIGVPPAGIGICLGVDRILDMSRTVLNVSGDLTIAACVASMEGASRDPLELA